MINEPDNPAILTQGVSRLSRKGLALEVSVFLLLIVPPSIVSLFVSGQKPLQGFGVTSIAVMARDVAWASLTSFLVWRNAEPLRAIGWTSKRWVPHLALGLFSFPLMYVGAGLVAGLLLRLGFSGPNMALRSVLSIHSASQIPLAVLLVAVVAVTEETVFRGYLLLRLTAVTGSTSLAVILSTLVFTLGHGYEGGAGLGAVAFMGLVFTAVYFRTGSLLAPIVMHFLQDFIGVVVGPLLAAPIK